MDLSDLSPAQREAVTHGEGPLLMLAGAGSGKTRALTHRVAYLIDSGRARPGEILAITFTNKAAREMATRVDRLLGGASGVWVHTFHAACLRVLRREAEGVGYPSTFAVYDSADQERLMRQVVQESGRSEREWPAAAVLARISRAKAELVGPEAFRRRYGGEFRADGVADLYARYQRALEASAAMDFDDLLRLAVLLFQTRPEVLAAYQERFRYILVDEYQDTNTAQYAWVRLLAGERRNVSVVGDPDQSIYGWRGADFRNILRFREDYPGARVVRLVDNYRSTGRILAAANAVVRHNAERLEKDLVATRGEGVPIGYAEGSDEAEEAALVVGEIARLIGEEGLAPSDIAVLYRTNAQSRPLEEALLRLALPYRLVGAARFYDRAEVKDALAYLRLVVQPRDRVAFVRAAQSPRRGLGEAALARLVAYAQERGGDLVQALAEADAVPGLTAPARRGAAALAEVLAQAARMEAEGRGPVAVLSFLIHESGLAAHLEGQRGVDPLAEGRLENLDSLVGKAREAEGQGISLSADFLAQVALASSLEEAAEGEGAVTLMTLHTAKGLEFPVVFLTGLEDGLFPHVRSLAEPAQVEEERRLMYVGVTRARDRLYLTRARARAGHGQSGTAVASRPSRFLAEIPQDLLAPFGAAAPVLLAPSRPWGGAVARPPTAAPAWTARPVWEGTEGGAFAPGEEVVHPHFGPGTVVAVRGSGPEAVVSVAFPGGGVRHLLVAYAGLRRVGA